MASRRAEGELPDKEHQRMHLEADVEKRSAENLPEEELQAEKFRCLENLDDHEEDFSYAYYGDDEVSEQTDFSEDGGIQYYDTITGETLDPEQVAKGEKPRWRACSILKSSKEEHVQNAGKEA